jgi:hypothetical protein
MDSEVLDAMGAEGHSPESRAGLRGELDGLRRALLKTKADRRMTGRRAKGAEPSEKRAPLRRLLALEQ